jgi:hypothetical protein
MKRGAKAGKAVQSGTEALPTVFTRGFVVAGLLAALQGGRRPGRDVLRFALQGGAALAAGTAAAAALGRRDYSVAAAAVIVGAAGVVAAEAALAVTAALAPSIEDKEADRG